MDTAKVFMSGRSQAVRLPKEYRFDTDEVIIRRTPEGILLIPKPAKNLGEALMEAFAELDALYPNETGVLDDFERPPQGDYQERESWWGDDPESQSATADDRKQALAVEDPGARYAAAPTPARPPRAAAARPPRRSKP